MVHHEKMRSTVFTWEGGGCEYFVRYDKTPSPQEGRRVFEDVIKNI